MADRVPSKSSIQPARGERAAITGYYFQYRGSAALMLKILEQSAFESIHIADPTAGTVDDWQVFTKNHLDAYQFKGNDFPRPLIPSDLFSKKAGKPCLIETLADGWRNRVESFPDRRIHIHLVTNGDPSTTPMKSESTGDKLGRKSLAAFVSDSWNAVHSGEKPLPIEGEAWSDTWQKFRKATKFSDEVLLEFVKSFHFKFSHRIDAPEGFSEREKQAWEEAVRCFTERLLAIPSNPSAIITLDYPELQEWFGISPSAPPRQLHEFRLDPNAKKPLRKTAEKLDDSLAQISSGYICLTGSPGSGKSSTLTLVLRRSTERVIRYYAYTPDSPNEDQGESANFYSRLADELNREGFRHKGTAPHRGDLSLLKPRFKEQLRELALDFLKSGKKTIILVDGLDHIEREQSPTRSLLEDLLSPSEIPEGVIFLLGTQTQRLLRSDIKRSLRDAGRSIEVSRMEEREVERILKSSKSGKLLSPYNLIEASRIVAGHPLALGYLIRKLDDCETTEKITDILCKEEEFKGDILKSYQFYWDDLGGSGFKVKQLLGYLARLRKPGEVSWIAQWADPESLDTIHTKFNHYFYRSESSYQFFHNSFRIFVIDVTSENPDGSLNVSFNQRYHNELAGFCASSDPKSIWHADQFHHLAESGQITEALEIANPEWFRSQFLAMRGRDEIYRDLHRAKSLAASAKSGLHVCRLAIADREIGSRFGALEIDSDRLLSILLQSGYSTEAMRLIRTEQKLLVRHEFGLQLCSLLREIGEKGEAEKVFDLINPFAGDAHSPREDFISAQRRMLVEWALTSRHYLPLDEALSTINSCEFKAGNAWSVQDVNQAEINQTLERKKTIADFSISARNHGCNELAEELEKLVDWTSLPKKYKLESILSILESEALGNDDKLLKIENWERLKFELLELLANSTIWQKFTAIEFLIRKDKCESARSIFSKIDPSNIARNFGRDLVSNEPELIARRWLTAALALGEGDLARSLFIDPAIKSRDSTKLTDSHLSVAALLAKSWQPDTSSQLSETGHFRKILAPLEKVFTSADDWSEVRRSMPSILEDLVSACISNGQTSITALSEFLNSCWEDDFNRRTWPLYFQRQLLTEMGKAGADPSWLARWLEGCETNIETAGSSGSRTSEYFDQAEAWLASGDKGRALTCAKLAFQFSLGVGYNQDYQLTDWILFLRHFWKENLKDALPLMTRIAESSVSLRYETSGGSMSDAAELLIAESFNIEPLLGVKIWDYFDQEAVVSFPDTLAKILSLTLKPQTDDPHIALLVLSEILVPTLDESDPDLIVHLLGRMLQAYGRDKAQVGVVELTSRIATLAKMENRAGWWTGIRRACKTYSLSLPPSPTIDSSSISGTGVTEESLTRIIESEDPIGILGEILATHRAREFSSGASSYLDLRRIVRIIALDINPSQIEQCRNLLANESYLAKSMIEALATRTSDPLIRSILCEWSKDLYEEAHGEEHAGSLFESEIRPLFVGILAADLSKGRDLLFESLREHDWFSSSSLHQLAKKLIQPEEYLSFSREVSTYVDTLLQGLESPTPILSPVELVGISSESESTALMRLVFRWLDHPTGVLRHGSRRIFRLLCQAGNITWRKELERQMELGIESHVVLQLLENVDSRTLAPISDSMIESLTKLSRSPDFESRALARIILSKHGIEVACRTTVDERHSTYRLTLPPAPLELNQIARYMGDFVSTCSLATGIPKANLYQRVNDLSANLQNSSGLNHQELSRRLADTNLYFGFRMPEKQVGLRVAFRVLAELHDSGDVPENEITSLLRIFSDQDDLLSCMVPISRPTSIPYLRAKQYSKAWSEEWLEQGEAHPLSAPVFEESGNLIIGYRHNIRVHTDHHPSEGHLGLIAPQSEMNALDHDSSFFDRAQPEHSSDYYTWSEKEDDRPLFVLGGQSKDLPCPPWLAFHPERARELGWTVDESSLFGWKDSLGNRVAESKWWTDGPPQHTSKNGNQITAAGWIVVVSPDAFRAIENRLGTMQFSSIAGRFRAR